MSITTSARRKLEMVASVTVACTISGFLYPYFFQTQPSTAYLWHAMFNGLTIGFVIGLAISVAELWYFQRHGRRLRFSVYLTVQTLFYIAVINVSLIGVMTFHMVLFHDNTFPQAFQSYEVQRYLQSNESFKVNAYALIVIFSMNFLRQINRMLGQNALLNFITGKYHKPVEEERVFMFLDLKDSTGIAERLGHKRYHQFLDDFFFDITPSIVESRGEIYQYVGDEVVVTWTRQRGLHRAECISCYFRIAAAIARVSDRYERRYGFIPTFKAGYHYGQVTTGLIGDIKRDIVFHGDTVNTASRIRSECSVVNRDLLLSQDLLQHLSISSYLTPESMGKIRLRGKEEEVELFSIREAA